MPDDERASALEAFTSALRRAWAKAGPVTYKEFEKQSKKILGAGYLSHSTVHSVLADPDRSWPPRWEWVLRFWKVLEAVAALHGIDPASLGTLEELKRLHESACLAQRPVRRLAGTAGVKEPQPGTGPGHGRGMPGGPGQAGAPGLAAGGWHDEGLASIRRRAGMEWWHDYDDVVPGWFGTYLSLEPAASRIHVYDTAIVPGQLQTEAYARAALRLEPCCPPEKAAARIIELRMRRQQALGGPNSPRLWAILDESALRCQVGDSGVMRAQLAHLLDICGRPNVTIQVIPSATSIRTTLGYPITLLRFRAQDVPDVAYIEQLTSASYLYDPGHVSRYAQVLQGLVLEALTPAGTADYLARLLRES